MRTTPSAGAGHAKGVLDPALVVGDVEPVQKEARFARLGKGNVDFKAWCRESLSRGAAGSHAFLRRVDELPQIQVTLNDKKGDGSKISHVSCFAFC